MSYGHASCELVSELQVVCIAHGLHDQTCLSDMLEDLLCPVADCCCWTRPVSTSSMPASNGYHGLHIQSAHRPTATTCNAPDISSSPCWWVPILWHGHARSFHQQTSCKNFAMQPNVLVPCRHVPPLAVCHWPRTCKVALAALRARAGLLSCMCGRLLFLRVIDLQGE